MNESEKKIGVLWRHKTKNGADYLRGEVNGERVVVFEVKEKRNGNSPDFIVLKPLPTPPNGEAEPIKETKPTNEKAKPTKPDNMPTKEENVPF
jgi:hypothetical protein